MVYLLHVRLQILQIALNFLTSYLVSCWL